MIGEILKELLPANPNDPNFWKIIGEKPWKDPIPALIFLWIPAGILLGILFEPAISKIERAIRDRNTPISKYRF